MSMWKDRKRSVNVSKHRPSPHHAILTTARVGPYGYTHTIYIRRYRTRPTTPTPPGATGSQGLGSQGLQTHRVTRPWSPGSLNPPTHQSHHHQGLHWVFGSPGSPITRPTQPWITRPTIHQGHPSPGVTHHQGHRPTITRPIRPWVTRPRATGSPISLSTRPLAHQTHLSPFHRLHGLGSYHHTVFKPVKRQLALRGQYCDCGCIQVTIYILDSGSIDFDECVCAHTVSIFWTPKARVTGLRAYN